MNLQLQPSELDVTESSINKNNSKVSKFKSTRKAPPNQVSGEKMKFNKKNLYEIHNSPEGNDDELGDYEYNYNNVAKTDEKKVKFDEYHINDINDSNDSIDNIDNNKNNVINYSSKNLSNFNDSYKSNYDFLNSNNYNVLTENTRFNNNELLNKLDYITHLLEEQHNEKTTHITEELILYLFLGIFIIYVLDSFAKASKYIR
tara:strand:- start:16611 stop:17216 length:606 start_codon:yes stop_codon:yes gene_type:complete